MKSLNELMDELSVLAAFVRDLDTENQYTPPVCDVIHGPLIKRMEEIIKLVKK